MSNEENVSLNVNPSEQTEPVSQPQEEPSSLTLTILLNVKNILDLAVARGAFRPEELSKVGGVYDKFTNGLKALQTQNELNKIEDNQ